MKQFVKPVLVILATTAGPALAQPDTSEHITVPSPNVVQKTNVGPRTPGPSR